MEAELRADSVSANVYDPHTVVSSLHAIAYFAAAGLNRLFMNSTAAHREAPEVFLRLMCLYAGVKPYFMARLHMGFPCAC
jgi:hypothetical protein